jgi:hypothetical protein
VGPEAGLRRQEVGYTFSRTVQYELTISYKKYTYAFDDSLKSLIVGSTWRPATAKGLTIETAAIPMGNLRRESGKEIQQGGNDVVVERTAKGGDVLK